MRLRHNYRSNIARKNTTFFLQTQYPVTTCVQPSLVAWQPGRKFEVFQVKEKFGGLRF
jgi:hypothetical protein